MPHGNRKVPFSGKRKKEQIIQKRQINKSNFLLRRKSFDDSDDSGEYQYDKSLSNVKSLNKQPANETNRNPNKYNLQFHEETKKELQQMKKAAHLPFKKLDDDNITNNEIDDNYFAGYDFPKRPKWHHNMSKAELSRNENRYFKEYIDELMKTHQQNNPNVTSVFELNLETWRQLWRVIEMSDVLLIVIDSRYPTLMFPPDLFDYLNNKLKKDVILILNKIDLISPECAAAWKEYFTNKYKGIHVVYFASYSRSSQKNRKYYLKRKSLVCWESIRKICDICKEMVSGHDIDLTSWEQKILEDSQLNEDETLKVDQNHIDETASTEFDESCTKFKNGILTIGCIGFPNVGKSSLINSLKGRKVVSVSKTPGHTKHFQTIFLTENVKLCDSPGLVFPSKTPKYLQVLIGSFPIAQLKEPNRSLMYVGERIDLPKILKINLPSDFDEWSAVAVCEAWCIKRGFLTAKACRPDHYRGANNLLRMILEGKIVIQIFPPQFKDKRDEFLKYTDLEEIRRIQGCEKYNIDEKKSSEDGGNNDDASSEETDSKEYDVADKQAKSTNQVQGVRKGNFFDLLESD